MLLKRNLPFSYAFHFPPTINPAPPSTTSTAYLPATIKSTSTMNLQSGLYIITFALLTLLDLITAEAAPPPTQPSNHPSPKYNWRLDLYHKKQCSGSATNVSGVGSTCCRNDVPSGGALAFIKVDLDPHCKVSLYKDGKCSHDQRVGDIHSSSGSRCAVTSSKKKKKKKHIKSYKVDCQ
ncbi:hypothetical protein N7532_002752 [Penicillium argentinense]|uniref:Uncharacterized protein n=1 Tax=Penicillium argentinense TaxID=1131581 RepID=A0A9W9G2J4_9EURO|nr:uncharacterized protein N7532_002752 [Penicillium argentinense]KAJ5110107.1 hypothetical protein N7532_002752 [Penicillium argentinense]